MSIRTPSLAAALILAASAALASVGDPVAKSPPPAPAQPSTSAAASTAPGAPRGEAERHYAAAYEEIAAAKQELAGNKAKNAAKRFRRALESGKAAVALDPRYHEAWNLVGYAARRLGDYEQAFAAYERCLAIKPDYAPAREYLGEAWLEKGDPKKAREQLVLLEAYGATASEDAKTLRAAIAAYEAAHPADAAAADSSAGAK